MSGGGGGVCVYVGGGGGGPDIEPRRKKSGRKNSWQWAKHAKLCSYLLLKWKPSVALGPFLHPRYHNASI